MSVRNKPRLAGRKLIDIWRICLSVYMAISKRKRVSKPFALRRQIHGAYVSAAMTRRGATQSNPVPRVPRMRDPIVCTSRGG